MQRGTSGEARRLVVGCLETGEGGLVRREASEAKSTPEPRMGNGGWGGKSRGVRNPDPNYGLGLWGVRANVMRANPIEPLSGRPLLKPERGTYFCSRHLTLSFSFSLCLSLSLPPSPTLPLSLPLAWFPRPEPNVAEVVLLSRYGQRCGYCLGPSPVPAARHNRTWVSPDKRARDSAPGVPPPSQPLGPLSLSV